MLSSPEASENTSVGGVDGGEDVGGARGLWRDQEAWIDQWGAAVVRETCEVDEVCVESITVPFPTIQR